jgi:hypothetical protein
LKVSPFSIENLLFVYDFYIKLVFRQFIKGRKVPIINLAPYFDRVNFTMKKLSIVDCTASLTFFFSFETSIVKQEIEGLDQPARGST